VQVSKQPILYIKSLISSSNNKKTLRKYFRNQRQKLTPSERARAANNIAKQLAETQIYKNALHIGVYSALPEEASLDEFSRFAWEQKKLLYLPVIEQRSNKPQMHFQAWLSDTKMQANSLGIAEPIGCKSTKSFKPKAPNLDLLLLPLVAYDKQGHRLGMGGGFYDRYIAQHLNPNCVRVGIAYSCQLAELIIPEVWDKNLHAIVNEEELIFFK